MKKYLVIDTESVFDPYLREAYECIEPGGRARIGCRSLVAISMWPIEIDALGRVDTGDLTTWTLADEGTESELLASALGCQQRRKTTSASGKTGGMRKCQLNTVVRGHASLPNGCGSSLRSWTGAQGMHFPCLCILRRPVRW